MLRSSLTSAECLNNSITMYCTAHIPYRLDFGRDPGASSGAPAYIQSTSGDYELLFSSADTGKQITSATATR